MLVPRSGKISLGGRRPPRLRSAPSRRCSLLSRLSSPSLFLLPFSVFWGLAPPRFQIWCCLSRNSVEAWRRSGCEVPSVGCGRGSLDLASDLDSGSRSVSFLCFLYLPFSAWVRRLAWLKALLGFSRRWRCGVSLCVLVFSAGPLRVLRHGACARWRVVGLVNHGFFLWWRHVQRPLVSGAWSGNLWRLLVVSSPNKARLGVSGCTRLRRMLFVPGGYGLGGLHELFLTTWIFKD
ncbi:hypothetical protein DY000_02033580 [Brassica cretica]|uniref:Transmembrane protein n=1 Tax=Brassica cretica TaxID=69181 RepID=A0ABQ7DKR0_BRACR|nr:hypothetical protein DY000_02033580 [Brassica cretica]